MPDLPQALIYYVVFLFSTTLHEAAHAWVAMRGGDRTAYHGGQVTLDPIPHIRREPFGMVVLPIISALATGWPIGFASAPYDPGWARAHPHRAAVMALAGPAANMLLVLITAGLLRAGIAAEVFYQPQSVRFGAITASDAGGWWPAVAVLLSAFFSLNLLLAAFNLIPLPPLDGSGAMPLLLSRQATRRYQEFLWGNPALNWIGLLVAWRLFDILFAPIFTGAVNLLYPGSGYH